MVRLKVINRTSTFAWSPGHDLPLIATGTVAGTFDADFSNTTELDLWELNLDDHSQEGYQLKPKATINSSAR
ncbi:Protein transport protein SEC31 [Neolecta irregularis DAH-3]|uniref:Protein transport protein SEC31 n=1 Tax=Neolecta irregularis (strain DAH-3) TaxID=1198029 RepID=A0A1U7LNH0_NEOID|nr:Protein transport protein SEC31 [Neolecta irregularis DAH-3]|eukprot:OLL24197.1 Protein transport protein SEC31 [Neolecta irregularis DAH-3]